MELLIIGNEILIGKFQDTNSNWMAKRITEYGHRVSRIIVVPDEIAAISDTLKENLNRNPDIIIISGGLGPTFDDMTLQGVGTALHRELKVNEKAYDMVKSSYDKAVKSKIIVLKGMTPEREKMAILPENAIPLTNPQGTAPGVRLKEGNSEIYCLPGVPTEMKAIFKAEILPVLKEKRGKFLEMGFYFSGIGESHVAPHVTKIEKKYPKLWIKTHPRIGLSEVELSITCFNVENGEQLAEKAIEELKKIIVNLGGKIT
ncbi:MAG: molybdopterin-binding protein [Promethearchaeota archaeon]